MRPLLQHASRSLRANVASIAPQRATNAALRDLKTRIEQPSICWSCQFRTASVFAPRRSRHPLSYESPSTKLSRRQFSSSSTTYNEKKSSESLDVPHKPEQPPPTEEPSASSIPESPPKPNNPKVGDPIARVPAEDLPSHRESQRWDIFKRIQEIMDDLLPKLAPVIHKVNSYTGTDYSSIEALRREIKEQEELVKQRRLAIDVARQAHDATQVQQASAQKEVVALLERKHSWSAADLERYMSLIRSEHVNDQAVHKAKDDVLAAENALEEARAQLEKRERAQYHEEQIWSDTIRRNSTWVTFGLMGVNIFLLLLSLAILEPWRRRRMVREIKAALDAHKPILEAPTTQPTIAMIEEAIDKYVEPASQPQEAVATVASLITSTSGEIPAPTPPKVSGDVQAETGVLAYDTVDPATEPPAPHSPDQTESTASVPIIDIEEDVSKDIAWLDRATTTLNDLKSKEPVTVRKQDLTVLFCAGAAAGWFFTTAVFLTMNRSP